MAEGNLLDSLLSGFFDQSLGGIIEELTDRAAGVHNRAGGNGFDELLSRQFVTEEASLAVLVPWFTNTARECGEDLSKLKCLVGYLTPGRLEALGCKAPERMPYYQYMLQFILNESKAVLAARLVNYVTVDAQLQRQLNQQGIVQVSIK